MPLKLIIIQFSKDEAGAARSRAVQVVQRVVQTLTSLGEVRQLMSAHDISVVSMLIRTEKSATTLVKEVKSVAEWDYHDHVLVSDIGGDRDHSGLNSLFVWMTKSG